MKRGKTGKIRRIQGKIALLAVLWMLAWPVCGKATTASDVEREKEQVESGLENTENKISDLENQKSKLEEYYRALDREMQALSDELAALEAQLAAKEQAILDTKARLSQARSREEQQRAGMMKRIKFIYEKGSADYITMIFSEKSISRILNKMAYVSRMYEYDRKMLEEYRRNKEQISRAEEDLRREQQELAALEIQEREKQDQAAARVMETAKEIQAYAGQLENAREEARQYEAALMEKEQELERIRQEEQRQQEAEIRRQEQAAQEPGVKEETGANSGISAVVPVSGTPEAPAEGDLAALAAIIECEAGAETYEGMLAVGSVVMNRVRSSLYPNTILGVLYQKGQFSPVASGRYAAVLARGAMSKCVDAARQTLAGYSNVGNSLGFKYDDGVTEGYVIGKVVFF